MKRLVVVIAVLLSFQLAFAQGGMKLGVEGNVALPNGDWSDIVSTGFGATVLFVFDLAPNMAITGNLGYLSFGGEKIETGSSTTEYSYSAIPILGGIRYYLGVPGGPRPHIGGQIGFHRFSIDADVTSNVSGFNFSGSTSASETEFSFAPVVGLEVNSLDLSAFYMLISDANYIGLRVGYTFPIGG